MIEVGGEYGRGSDSRERGVGEKEYWLGKRKERQIGILIITRLKNNSLNKYIW